MSATIIAERTFQSKDAQDVKVLIYAPVQVEEGQWKCNFTFVGISPMTPYHAIGVDSLQALILGIERVGILLEPYQSELNWPYAEDGDLGLSRYITAHLGINFANNIKKYMQEEEAKFVQQLKSKSRGTP